MTTKKKTTKTAKVADTIKPVYIAVDKLNSSVATDDALMCLLSDCEYVSAASVNDIVDILDEDVLEDDKEIYKITFTKVGRVDKPKVIFTKEG